MRLYADESSMTGERGRWSHRGAEATCVVRRRSYSTARAVASRCGSTSFIQASLVLRAVWIVASIAATTRTVPSRTGTARVRRPGSGASSVSAWPWRATVSRSVVKASGLGASGAARRQALS